MAVELPLRLQALCFLLRQINAFASDRPKPYPASILAIHTPSTAQFVVISGRNTPSEL